MTGYVRGVVRNTANARTTTIESRDGWLYSTERRRVQRPVPQYLKDKIALTLNTGIKFTLGQIITQYGAGPDPIVTAGATEYDIRHPMNVALGIAYALKTGMYNSTLTTYSEADARLHARRIIDGTSARWGSGTGKFQYGWQTMMWTSMMVEACKALGDWPQSVVDRVVAAHQAECVYIANSPTPYWLRMDGTEISPGNTRAEEAAWMGVTLYGAYLEWPNHPSAPAWKASGARLLAAATTSLSDLYTWKKVHGVKMIAIFNGANVWDDGGVRNHNIIHPAYVMSMMENQWQTAMLAAHRGEPIPEAAFHGAERAYHWLVDVIQATGKPVYLPGQNTLHFPEGTSSHPANRIEHAILSDIMAHRFGLDSTVSVPAEVWADRHLNRLIELQTISGDGSVYGGTVHQEKNIPRWIGLAAMAATAPDTPIYYGEIEGEPWSSATPAAYGTARYGVSRYF